MRSAYESSAAIMDELSPMPPGLPRTPGVVGILHVEIHLPLCRSLKAKRGIIARTLNHLRKHQPIAIAEVEHQNLWGRAGIAAVTVSADRTVVERILHKTVGLIERDREVQLIDYSIEIL